MKLATYIAERRGAATSLASAVGTSVSTITRLADGSRQPSLRLALAIKEATGGAVCPEDFERDAPQPHPEAA